MCTAVECHGTGTPTGDPIEIFSVGKVFGQGTGIALGAIKSNINHTESAAGLAGFLKAVHVVQRSGMFPHGAGLWSPEKSIDLETGGSSADLAYVLGLETRLGKPTGRIPNGISNLLCGLLPPGGKGLVLSTEFQPLKISGVGVNSFGFSGTNVHAAVMPPDAVKEPLRPQALQAPHVLLLSSHSQASLNLTMGNLEKELQEGPCSEATLLQVGKQSLCRDFRSCRKAFLQQTPEELLEVLKRKDGAVSEPSKLKKLVLVVPGNGCQVPKMLLQNLGNRCRVSGGRIYFSALVSHLDFDLSLLYLALCFMVSLFCVL